MSEASPRWVIGLSDSDQRVVGAEVHARVAALACMGMQEKPARAICKSSDLRTIGEFPALHVCTSSISVELT